MRHPTYYLLAMMVLAAVRPAVAEDLTVKMFKATQDGTSDSVGTIIASADPDTGATFHLKLHGLPPGQHGFHLHENPSCGPTLLNGVRIPAGAAGGHYDPDHVGRHEGPDGDGHIGDLPFMDVQPDGTTTQTLVAPRIKDLDTLRGHALVINIGGDNYKDTPYRDGGGGGRLACGVIE